MNALPAMLAVWTVCAVVFAALMLYRSHLTRHEVDQVFLDEFTNHNNEREHDDIVRRVERIRPFVQYSGGAAALLLVGMIGIYIANVLPNVRF